jgi:site-specific DNA-methyltransferase (adenine-specific)
MYLKCYRCAKWPCACADGIALICGDVRNVTASIDERFDMELADPPYGETSIEWDCFPNGWIAETWPLVKAGGSLWCFGSARMFLQHPVEFAGLRFVQDVVWEKHNGSGFLVDRFRRVHESAYHYVRCDASWADIYKAPQFTNDAVARVVRKKEKPAHWHGKTGATTYVSQDGGPRMMRSVMHVRSMHGRALHPTEKPLGILTPLIEYSCPPGGSVLVPFAGCGSELVAAKQLKRRAVGVEINEAYCEKAAERLRGNFLDFGDDVA